MNHRGLRWGGVGRAFKFAMSHVGQTPVWRFLPQVALQFFSCHSLVLILIMYKAKHRSADEAQGEGVDTGHEGMAQGTGIGRRHGQGTGYRERDGISKCTHLVQFKLTTLAPEATQLCQDH